MLAPVITRALAGALPVADLTGLINPPRLCTNMSCSAAATAQVLVAASWMDKCFTHEREYADRYGCIDIRPLP